MVSLGIISFPGIYLYYLNHKSMPGTNSFFKEYAIASTQGTPEEIAKFYSPSFIIASKTESQAYTNDDNFLKWLDEVHQFNLKSGLERMEAIDIKTNPVGENFIQATVTWEAFYSKLSGKGISFDMHYVLNSTTEGFKIVLYISEQDQEQLMKMYGLI